MKKKKQRKKERQADGRTKGQKNKTDNTCIDDISFCNHCNLFAVRIFLRAIALLASDVPL